MVQQSQQAAASQATLQQASKQRLKVLEGHVDRVESELANYAEPTITSLVEKAKDLKPRLAEVKHEKIARTEIQTTSDRPRNQTED